MQNKRIGYISIFQIIGPIFVILGHSLNGFDYTGPWFIFTKEWIYIFHMPLFFMISGYLIAYKGYLEEQSYGTFILGKIKRLLIPYFFWNIFVWIIMIIYKITILHTSVDFYEMLIGFIRPRTNALTYTWFLFALFIAYLLTPIFQKVLSFQKPVGIVITLIICIVLYMLPIKTEYFALSDLHKDLLFFVLGCLLGQLTFEKLKEILKKIRIIFIIGAIIFSIVSLIWFEKIQMFNFITCFLILMSMFSLFIEVKELPAFWTNIASFSFGIYIMHWPVMLATRYLMQKLGACIAVTVSTMCIVGYFVPILIIIVVRLIPFKKIKKPLKYLLGV